MREDQYMGLHKNAFRFLEQYANRLEVTTHKTVHNPRTNISYEETHKSYEYENNGNSKFKYFSMFDFDEPTGTMSSYVLKDGRMVHEILQNTVWSSGPMFYTALAWENGEYIKESLWPQEEIGDFEPPPESEVASV